MLINPLVKSTTTVAGYAIVNSIENPIASLTQAKLKSDVFLGDKSQCEEMGTVESTYYELTEIAVKVYNRDPYYNFFNNNSQHFCKKYLQETVTVSQTSETDLTAALYNGTAVGVSCAAILVNLYKFFF